MAVPSYISNTVHQAQQKAQAANALKSPSPTPPTTPQAAAILGQQTGVSLTPTTPGNDLRGSTISVAPTANRMDLAKQYTATQDQQLQPYFQRDLRDATSNAAAKGQLGSGQLRSSLGDVVNQYANARQTGAQNFYTSELDNAINDAYKNVAQANQQQAFQAGLQNQTFGQDLARYQAGVSGDPSATQLALSQQYGNNAATAGNALGSAISGTQTANANQANNDALNQLLQRLGIGGTTSGTSITPSVPIISENPIYG
jgi:hypothetical protein